MKILIATESYYPDLAGGAVMQHNLALDLARAGHEVAVLAPSSTGKHLVEEDRGTTVFRLSSFTFPLYKEFKITFFPYRTIKKIIYQFKPEIIHIHNPFGIGMSTLYIARKEGIPIVATNHLMPENLFMAVAKTRFLYGILKNLGWFFIVWFHNKTDFVTSPTQTAVDLLIEHGLKVKALPVSNGVDLRCFNPKSNGDHLRQKFNIPNKPIVLYTGRMSGEKSLDILAKAIPLVRQKVDAHFVFAGTGREKKNLQGLIAKLGMSPHVTFVGYLQKKDFPNIYRINPAQLFAIPSTAELQSIVTMEALASGLPVVAADAGALPELVHHQENGLLFPPGDPVQCAQGIIRILTDPKLREKMGQKSLEVIRPHSFERSLKKFQAIYYEVLKTRKKC